MTRYPASSSAPAAGLLLGTLMALAGPAWSLETTQASLTGQVVTADQIGGSLSLVDLATGEVAAVPVPVAPHNVDASADGRFLLAVGEPKGDGHGHTHDEGAASGLLVVLDATAPADGPVAQVPVGSHPAHVVTDREGRRAFVTNAGGDTVSVVDLASFEVVGTIATGAYPHGLRASPLGSEIWVANVEDGSVSVIDGEALTEVARIAVGAAPVQVGFLPDGSLAYVSLRDEDAVAVIDTATREVVARVPVGNGPIQMHATPDGRHVYVANEGFEDEPSNLVSVIDTATNTVVATIPVGDGPHGVSVSDGAVFVTNIRDDSLSVIDPATREVVATLPVGDGPNGVVYLPAALE